MKKYLLLLGVCCLSSVNAAENKATAKHHATKTKKTAKHHHTTATKATALPETKTTQTTPTQSAQTKTPESQKTPTTTTLPTMLVTDTAVAPEPLDDGRPERVSKTNIAMPRTKVTRADFTKTNSVTTSDTVKYESGIFVRQRYIGDPNAPIAMRGSSPYQSARVMVFMDGMPIWNPLQSSYNGAPRWGLVSPGEIKSIDILGGPFSSEYSGNSMGGVVNYNTRMPQKREIYTEATYMLQPYNTQGTNANLQGFKTFGSYGDKFDDLSVYFSTNHLENEGQPMTPTSITSSSPSGLGLSTKKPLNGGITEVNPKGSGTFGFPGGVNMAGGLPMVQIGSDGIYHSTDDLLKWKGLYDITKDLNTSVTVAYETLTVAHTGQSYLTNAQGQTVWGSQMAGSSVNGYGITSNNTALGQSRQDRDTLTLGWGLNGKIFGNWNTNTNISWFDILNDTTLASTYNPLDPNYNKVIPAGAASTGASSTSATTYAGTKTSWNHSGWVSASTKFDNQEFLGRKDLSFSGGYEYQHARLLITTSNMSNIGGTAATSLSNPLGINTQSGGSTDTHGLFGQFSWRFLPTWDLTAGTRWEHWVASNGTYLTSSNLTGSLSPQNREVNAWSPKVSLGFEPGNWKFRYSFGKAYRFPVADELYGNSNSANGSSTVANATLKPESGYHHNLLLEYDFNDGFVRANLFHENIRNVIYSQYAYLNGSSVLSSIMSSMGEVETNGLDISANRNRIMGFPVDVKLNSTMLNSKIISNPLNPYVVGNQMPLMPHYRVNAITTYHYGSDWDFTIGSRYQSKMYSQIDNKDVQVPFYGAFTQSFNVDLNTTYHFNNQKGHVSLGINNVNNYQAFFNHPLPMRSYFIQVGYKW